MFFSLVSVLCCCSCVCRWGISDYGDFVESHCSTSRRPVITSHHRIALLEPLLSVMSRGHAAYISHKVVLFNWRLVSVQPTASQHRISSMSGIESIKVIVSKNIVTTTSDFFKYWLNSLASRCLLHALQYKWCCSSYNNGKIRCVLIKYYILNLYICYFW